MISFTDDVFIYITKVNASFHVSFTFIYHIAIVKCESLTGASVNGGPSETLLTHRNHFGRWKR